MTTDKPACEMPSYCIICGKLECDPPHNFTLPVAVPLPRADKPDAAAAREALDDLTMWVRELREIVPRDGVEMCGVSARLMNIEAWCRNEIPTIKRILQREAGE